MVAKYFLILGSLLILILGVIHLYYTFFSNKFLARDAETVERMKKYSPLLTKRTTMWEAWVGFNGSHSLGAIFFGMVNLILALQYVEIFQKSIGILILDDLTLLFYQFLAIKYWFKIPIAGIAVSAFCFLAATLLIVLGQ